MPIIYSLHYIANFSDTVSLIMPVNKQDGTICIQDDYKLMVNKIAKPDVCPLIKTDELLTAPRGTVKTFASCVMYNRALGSNFSVVRLISCRAVFIENLW